MECIDIHVVICVCRVEIEVMIILRVMVKREVVLMVYSSPSISGVEKAWVLLRKMKALPLARRTDTQYYAS